MSAVAVQAAWRGRQERATHPKARRLAEVRRRLAQAYANALGLAHRSLAARTRVGLEGLLSAAHIASVSGHRLRRWVGRHVVLVLYSCMMHALGAVAASWALINPG